MGIQQVLMSYGATGVNPDALSIYNALVAYWDMDENNATAQMLDSKGSNHLSLRNTSGSIASSSVTASGLISRAYFPNASSGNIAYIPRSNTALDITDTDQSFGGWVRGVSSVAGSARFYMGRVGSNGTTPVAWLSLDGTTGNVLMNARTSGGSNISVDAGKTLDPTAWTLVIGTFNRGANTIEIRVRKVGDAGLTYAQAAFSSAIYTAANTSNFSINGGLSADSTYFTGTRDAVFYSDASLFAAKAVSDAEFSYLYNSGAGKNFAAIKSDSGN